MFFIGRKWILSLSFLTYVVALPASAVTLPYTEDFDGETSCTIGCANACPLSESGWTNASNDDWDWLVNQGGTTSDSTGPSGDHTSGSGNYLYIETSGTCGDQSGTAFLISPPLELTGTSEPAARFWYHQFGTHIGELHVDVLDSELNPIAIDALPPITGGDSDEWFHSPSIDLEPYVGQESVHIQIRAVHSGNGFEGDQAVDDFAFFEDIDTDGDGEPDFFDSDDDNDGMPDTFETENGLDPLDPGDAEEDADNDGLDNLGEFNAETDPNDPDTDGDWIGDLFDVDPVVASNLCTGTDAILSDLTVMGGETLQCGAESSIVVQGTVAIQVGGALELIAPNDGIDAEFSVEAGGEFVIYPLDPTPP